MIIRNYQNNDVGEITKLAVNLHPNYVFSLNEFSSCMVSEEKNKIIGFIVYDIMYDRAEIIDIYVSENHRRKKVGSSLIKKVIDECYKNNCENITLDVDIYNQAALDFYYDFDFKIVARRQHYYKDSMDDAYVMEKKLR